MYINFAVIKNPFLLEMGLYRRGRCLKVEKEQFLLKNWNIKIVILFIIFSLIGNISNKNNFGISLFNIGHKP